MNKKLVIIKWHDTCNIADWQTMEELKEWSTENTFEVYNIGYIAHETKDFIIVCARVAENEGQYGLCEKIPKVTVEKITKL